MKNATYIGDGAYAKIGSWPGEIVIYTINGITVGNEVVIELTGLDHLHKWAHDRYKALTQPASSIEQPEPAGQDENSTNNKGDTP